MLLKVLLHDIKNTIEGVCLWWIQFGGGKLDECSDDSVEEETTLEELWRVQN